MSIVGCELHVYVVRPKVLQFEVGTHFNSGSIHTCKQYLVRYSQERFPSQNGTEMNDTLSISEGFQMSNDDNDV